jgi:hypothetical protein
MGKKPLRTTSLKATIPDIDLKPGPFTMSFDFDLEPLRTSIAKFGVLNPPYVLENSGSKPTVVAGYRRLSAARELGWPDIVCKMLPEDFPPFEALLLNLYDNLVHRRLNNIEKAMTLDRLTRFLPREQVVADFMPMLDLRPNKHTLELFLSLVDLEETIKISVARERLSLRVAGLMSGIGTDDRLRINELFTSLKWSFNQQWETTQWVMEIASREGRSIKGIIDEGDITEVLGNDRMNDPQKVKAIVKILKARRFPSLLNMETRFRKGLIHLSLPSGVRITPPPSFEGLHYKLEIAFTKGQELKEVLAELSRLPGLEKVTDFWRGGGHG